MSFFHDNARPHIARIVQVYITKVGFLNLIHYLWDELKRRNSARPCTAISITELTISVKAEWFNISQETITNLTRSMPNRMFDGIKARGGYYTHY